MLPIISMVADVDWINGLIDALGVLAMGSDVRPVFAKLKEIVPEYECQMLRPDAAAPVQSPHARKRVHNPFGSVHDFKAQFFVAPLRMLVVDPGIGRHLSLHRAPKPKSSAEKRSRRALPRRRYPSVTYQPSR